MVTALHIPHGVSLVLAPPPPTPASPVRRRVALGVDAADVAGVAIWDVPDEDVYLDAREGARCRAACVVRTHAAGFTEADAVRLVDDLLGDAEWIAAVERPFGVRTAHVQVGPGVWQKVKRGTPPTQGQRFWTRVVDLVARWRATQAGVQFRKPLVLRPKADDWRRTIGVVTAGDVKADAIRWLARLGVTIHQHDAAEAACIAHYAARAGRRTSTLDGRKVVAVRWVR